MIPIVVLFVVSLETTAVGSQTRYLPHNPKTHRIIIPKSFPYHTKVRLLRIAIKHDKWVLHTRKHHTRRMVAFHWRQKRWMHQRLANLYKHHRHHTRWHHGVASFYSANGATGGCGGTITNYTFASYQVPCFARVEFCLHGRCITGKRVDSGPNGSYRYSRQFDLSGYIASYLGFTSAGITTVKWRRIK